MTLRLKVRHFDRRHPACRRRTFVEALPRITAQAPDMENAYDYALRLTNGDADWPATILWSVEIHGPDALPE